MLISLTTLFTNLSSIFHSRAALELENLALRHQIGVLQRSTRNRPKLTLVDRLLWVWLSRIWKGWRSALAIVRPETVLVWHREGFRLFWTWKVRRGHPGQPVISREVRDLIRKMCERIPLGVRHASTANCSSSASTSGRAASADTWCAPQTAVSDVAHIPRESRPAAGLHRFLHGAHDPFPGPLRVPGVGP